MNAPQWFSLATRLAGLWILLGSLPGLPRSIFKIWTVLFAGRAMDTVEGVISLVWVYAVAWWFLTGAPWLQRLVFPGSPDIGATRPE